MNLTVDQVTQAMSNVSWSHAKAAQSFITSLTSQRGHARCHTQDSHCLMGCITCGTNYTVTVETFSTTGRATNCTYQGFSSSRWPFLWRQIGWQHRKSSDPNRNLLFTTKKCCNCNFATLFTQKNLKCYFIIYWTIFELVNVRLLVLIKLNVGNINHYF